LVNLSDNFFLRFGYGFGNFFGYLLMELDAQLLLLYMLLLQGYLPVLQMRNLLLE
jgi:hypothetical protein